MNQLLRAFLCMGGAIVVGWGGDQLAQADTYYWDANGGASGFGTAGGTWGTSAFWNTNSSGTPAPTVAGATTSDDLHFGTNTNGLAAGTVNVSGTAQAASINVGSASGTVVLSGGSIQLPASSTISNAVLFEINSNLLSSGTVNKSGAGISTFSGNNSGLTGSVALSAGHIALASVNAGSAAAAWNLNSSGVILSINSDRVNNSTLQLGALSGVAGATLRNGGSTAGMNTFSIGALGTNTTFAGNIIDPAANRPTAIVKVGAGTLTLSGTNTHTGGTTINAGTLALSGGSAMANTATVTLANVAGATLRLDSSETLGFVTGGGATGGNVNLQNNTLTLNTASNSNFSGGLISGSSGVLVKNGAAILTLAGNNSGLTGSVNLSAGHIALASANAGSAAAAWNLNSSGVILSINGDLINNSIQHLGALSGVAGATLRSGGSTTGMNTFSIGALGTNTTFAGTIIDQTALIKTAIIKVGGGTLTLTGANTYSSGTTLSAGTLLANNTSGSATGTGAVVVNGGVFGGAGAVSSAITINGGGTLAPGASIQSLSSGTLTFNTGSTFAYEIDSAASLGLAGDLQVVNGALNLNGVVNLTLADLSPSSSFLLPLSTTLTLINFSGLWDGGLFTYQGNELADGETFAAGKYFWQIDYDALSDGANFASEQIYANHVNLTLMGLTVPEPSTGLLGLCGIFVLAWRLQRNRKLLA